jgi:hypothetical protein
MESFYSSRRRWQTRINPRLARKKKKIRRRKRMSVMGLSNVVKLHGG